MDSGPDRRTCAARVAYVTINGTALGVCWGLWFGPVEARAIERLVPGSSIAMRCVAALRSSVVGTALGFAAVFASYQGVLCVAEPHMRQWKAGGLAGGVVGLVLGLGALPAHLAARPASALRFASSYALPFAAVSAGFQLVPTIVPPAKAVPCIELAATRH
jgi:hypothetical protein